MNDLPQEQLNQLLTTHGQQLHEDQQRCEALLRDTFPGYPRQVSLLVNAMKQGVPQELLASHNKIPFEVTRSRLAHKLAENLFVQDQAAEWAIDAWSEALGVKQTINRPMSTMQPPELGGPSGGQPNYGQGSGQWTNSPPAGGAYNPTVVSSPTSGNTGVPGSAPTAVNPGSNSGNYNNPANYNAPNYNDPSYNNPTYGNPGASANYGTGSAPVQPGSGTPTVWIWFIVYCVVMVLIYLVNVAIGFGVMFSANSDGSSSANLAFGLVRVLFYGILLILTAIAPLLPKRGWVWIYDIVVMCLGFITCCAIPAGVALLIFWVKPNVKAFFNMQTT